MSDTKKLHQINMQYSSTEDRILLRTLTNNNDEYLIWLTRRYTKLLLDIIDKEIEKHGGTAEVSKKKETKKMFSEGAFEKPYIEDTPKNRPLGDKAILAYAITTRTDNHGNFLLEIKSADKKGLTYNLNETLIYMFYSLLTQAIEQADWNLGKFGTRTPDTPLH